MIFNTADPNSRCSLSFCFPQQFRDGPTDVVCNRLAAEDFAKDVKGKAETLGQEAKAKGTTDPTPRTFQSDVHLRECD